MKIIVVAAVVASCMVTAAAFGQSIQCGLKPLAPLGCKSENAHCVCDAQGNCHWEFDCSR